MCGTEQDLSPADYMDPVLSSLYAATCRWKCLLMVHLDWLKEVEKPTGEAPHLNQCLEPLRTDYMIDQLIRGLHQLVSFMWSSVFFSKVTCLAVVRIKATKLSRVSSGKM